MKRRVGWPPENQTQDPQFLNPTPRSVPKFPSSLLCFAMPQAIPSTLPTTSEETPQTCDSPSGSSTSEPHDDSMHVQQPFIDQSFFHKLDQLSPDNPLYFMQQQLSQQQQQRRPEDTSLEEEDQSMGEASAEAESQTSALSPQSVPGHPSPQPAILNSTMTQSPASSNVIEPLQPSNVSAPGSNQTFWSGVNNVSPLFAYLF